MTLRLGLGLTGIPYNTRQMAQYAVAAENKGFDSVWIAEDYVLRDAVTTMAAIAGATKHIKIGPGAVNPYTRNPVLLAETVATLDELSGGRTFLTLGSGAQPLLEAMGIAFRHPVATVREAVLAIRAMLQGGRVEFYGSEVKVAGLELGFTPYLEPLGKFSTIRRLIPIYVAAIGPRMLQMAGEVGDGVLLTVGCSPKYVQEARRQLKIGAENAHRSLDHFEVAAYVFSSLSDSSKVVRELLALEIADSSNEFLVANGVEPSSVEPMRKTFRERGIRAASELVTKELLDTLSACGPPDKIRTILQRYEDAGATLPVIMPVDTEVPRLIDTLSPS